ncbi:hypothetical protein V1520DRAFT_373127 [Lipomyces starkeyi]
MAHPFTISSLPEDNKMLCVIRVKTGFIKRMLEKTLLIGADLEKHDGNAVTTATYPSTVHTEGLLAPGIKFTLF